MARPALLPLLLSLLAAPAAAQVVGVELLASGLDKPVRVAAPPGDARLFVLEKAGYVRILVDGDLNAEPFLDLSAVVNQQGEGGLLGIAFPADFASSGRVFVSYTTGPATGSTLVSRFLVSASDPDRVDPNSETIVLGPLAHDTPIHRGGGLAFSPLDGNLYITLGDGGPGNDPNGRAQDLTQLQGKVLRLDVDLPFPHVPGDNPFTATPGARAEIWAYGLRNPWGFSIDPDNGDLWIADVGEDRREEVDRIAFGLAGANLGWRCEEGSACTGLSGCDCGSSSLLRPVHEYSNFSGCAVIGGVVYRGSLFPDFVGRFFFADFCSNQVWSFERQGAQSTDLVDHSPDLVPRSGNVATISSVGVDAQGELVLVDYGGGELWRVVPCRARTYCIGASNSVGAGSRMDYSGKLGLAANEFALSASAAPANVAGVFFYGSSRVQVPFGNGFRCVGGETFRLLPVQQASPAGRFERAVDLSAPRTAEGRILAGSTWHFQLWFRDQAAGGARFNLSNGLEVTFCP